MNRRDRFSLAAVALVVAAAIFALGGATRWAQAVVSALAVVGFALTVRSRRRFERVPPLLAFLALAAAWTFLQAVPLPSSLVESLSPTLAGLRSDGATLAGVSPLSSISVDPAATLRMVVFFITLAGVAVVALRVSVSETGRYWLLSIVAGAAGVAALVAGVHELFGATRLYGVYEPRQLPPILGPLLNTNQLGGLMAVGAVLSGGLMLYQRQPFARRALWLVIALACVGVTTATFSRGAVIGLGTGVLVMIGTLFAQRLHAGDSRGEKRREKFLATTLPVGVIVVCALFLGVYMGGGTVMNQLENTSFSELNAPRTKYAAWISSATLIEEAPWTGVGRGAFESAFTRVHPASAYSTFSHPENEVVQAVVEWGIPAALALGLLAGWTILAAVRRWRDGPLTAGALGALMVVAFQCNFDFGLELYGLAAPMTVILATLTYVPTVEMRSVQAPRFRGARVLVALLMLAGAVVLLTPSTRTLDEDHETLRGDPAPAVITDAIEAHPLDYFGYAVLAQYAFEHAQPDAIRLLNHALRLHPTHPGLHRIAARLLARAGVLSQAEAEYATAVRYSKRLDAVIPELVAALPVDSAARAIPLDMHQETMIKLLPYPVAAAWLTNVLAHPGDARTAENLYRLALSASDWPVAERAARALCRETPSRQCQLSLARVLRAQNKYAEVIEAVRDVDQWTGRRDEQLSAWVLLCEAYTRANQQAEAARCQRHLDTSGLRAPASRD